MDHWQNKVAVVTGASCGIGAAVCKDLVAKGMIVAGFARRVERVLRKTQIVAENNTADLKATLDTNVMAVALCTREAFQSMMKRGVDGHIFCVNSIAGHYPFFIPGESFNMYPSSKYAITAMTEFLRREFQLNETRIRVTSISSGEVKTEMFEGSDLPDTTPLLRPEDISDAIVYCLQTPPHVQIHEMIIKPLGEPY